MFCTVLYVLALLMITHPLCFVFGFEKCPSLACLSSLYPQELDDIRKSELKVFKNIDVDESNILNWKGLIVPVSTVNSLRVFR